MKVKNSESEIDNLYVNAAILRLTRRKPCAGLDVLSRICVVLTSFSAEKSYDHQKKNLPINIERLRERDIENDNAG